MRVLLIAANTERINMPTPPLGAASVGAAVAASGHEVVVLDLMGSPDPGREVADAAAAVRPGVIGISVRNVDDQCMERPTFLLDKVRPVVAACRESSTAPVVLGGAGYSIFPRPALAFLGADLGVRGEGEEVFPALVDAVAKGADPGALPGVECGGGRLPAVRRRWVDLDQHPYPLGLLRPSLDLSDPQLWVPFQTRRGCPLRCAYCSTPVIEGRRLRLRSLDAVVADLDRLALAGARRIYFVDNTFNLPPSYALALSRRIAERGLDLEWRAILYPDKVSAELAETMAEAGCVEVALGFESGSPAVLRSLGKPFGPEAIRHTAEVLAGVGIRRAGFLLVGAPGETVDTVRASLDLVATLDLEMVKVTTGVRVYPGTPLAATSVAEGVVDASDDLLRPTFYLAGGLGSEWVESEARARLPRLIPGG